MKPSIYNLIFEYKGKKLAFNSSTCALAEVNDDFFNILDNCQNSEILQQNEELVENMKSGNYIVEDDKDELASLKLLNYNGKFGSKDLSLVIAPTLICNFACPYCFENPSKTIMSKKVQKAIFDWVESVAKLKSNINVTWYGGEPLIAKKVIFDMSERFIDIARKYGVNYSASMVTNGYLIDESVIENMLKFRILDIQVTIDGPKDIHNQRRKLKVDDGIGTFNKIIENVKHVIAKNISVSIRINVDKNNEDKLEELLDFLKLNEIDKCNVNFGHVRPYTEFCSSISSDCLSTREYAKLNLKYQHMLDKKGFGAVSYPNYPGTKSNYCCADSVSSFVIDPDGDMYKCWNDVGDKSRKVGNVISKSDDLFSNSLNAKYMLWSPFDFNQCKKCNILPICMGGCPYEGQKSGKPDCEKWIYNLIDTLKFTYDVSSKKMA